ncbi:MAG: Holliday junction branch migration protein RuvA [Parcubacteria group bacterium]|nr:Holliday junction branch migration protein RuvA [Parcubacteria group bacterium]
MISWLKGKVQYQSDNFIILDVNNIGYEIFIPVRSMRRLSLGAEREWFICSIIREDSHTLYGFELFEELSLFKELISVSGIGPKTAMAIFNQCGGGEIIGAIRDSNAAFFCEIPGIGLKTANRMILELKEKIEKKNFTMMASEITAGSPHNDREAFDALLSLGYYANQVRAALNNIPKGLSVEGSVREALKVLNRS